MTELAKTTGAFARGSIHWGELRDPDVEQARDDGYLVIVPLGAIEQHGSHLPVDTDIAIAAAVADAVARRLGRALVAPPIQWGYSASHMGFASTISLRPETITALLEDICGSLVAHGFEKIAILSSHATNRPVAQLFVREYMAKHGVTIAYVHYTDFGKAAFTELRQTRQGGEMHAGEFETALQLHLHSDLVDMDSAEGVYVDPKEHFGVSTAASDITDAGTISLGYDIKSIFPGGVMGDPTPATAELGAALFKRIVDSIATVLAEYHEARYPATRVDG